MLSPRERSSNPLKAKKFGCGGDIQREAPIQPNSASVAEDTSLGAMATQGISTSRQEGRASWMPRSIAQHGGPGLRPS